MSEATASKPSSTSILLSPSSKKENDILIRVKGSDDGLIQEQRFHVADADILKDKSEFFRARCSSRWGTPQRESGTSVRWEIVLEGPETAYIGYVLKYIQDSEYEFPEGLEKDCLDALQYFGVAERGLVCAKHGVSTKNLLVTTKSNSHKLLQYGGGLCVASESFLVTSLPELASDTINTTTTTANESRRRWRYRISFGTYTSGLLVQAPSSRWLVKYQPTFWLGDFPLFDWAYLLCQARRKNPGFSMHSEFLYFYSLYIPIYFSSGSTGGISHFVDVECAHEVEHWDDLKIQVMGEVSLGVPGSPMIYQDLEGGWAHFRVESPGPERLHVRVRSIVGTKDLISVFTVDDSGEVSLIPIDSVHVYSDYWNRNKREREYCSPGTSSRQTSDAKTFQPRHGRVSGIKKVHDLKNKPFLPPVPVFRSLGCSKDDILDDSKDTQSKQDASDSQHLSSGTRGRDRPGGLEGMFDGDLGPIHRALGINHMIPQMGILGIHGPGGDRGLPGNQHTASGYTPNRSARDFIQPTKEFTQPPNHILQHCQSSQCVVYGNDRVPSLSVYYLQEDGSRTIGSLEEDLCWTQSPPSGSLENVENEKIFSVDHVREAAHQYNAIPAKLRARLNMVQRTAMGEGVLVDHVQETVIYHITFPKETVRDVNLLHVVVIKNAQSLEETN